jgi:ssDNA-binding Zn-finger/Zn-ribbon topoisomerase 1
MKWESKWHKKLVKNKRRQSQRKNKKGMTYRKLIANWQKFFYNSNYIKCKWINNKKAKIGRMDLKTHAPTVLSIRLTLFQTHKQVQDEKMEKMFHANDNQKRVAILISDKIIFR